jgi:hypothetical protein
MVDAHSQTERLKRNLEEQFLEVLIGGLLYRRHSGRRPRE